MIVGVESVEPSSTTTIPLRLDWPKQLSRALFNIAALFRVVITIVHVIGSSKFTPGSIQF